jgi:tetratricopeptide (TPR) repeat protein
MHVLISSAARYSDYTSADYAGCLKDTVKLQCVEYRWEHRFSAPSNLRRGGSLPAHPALIAFKMSLRQLTYLAIVVLCTSILPAQTRTAGRAEIVAELQKGNNGAALTLIRQALAAAPHDCSLLSLEGIAFAGQQQNDSALRAFRRAVGYCPNYLAALEGAAQIEYSERDAETVPLLKRILVLKPDNATANAMLATILQEQGKCQEALGPFEASKKLFLNRPALQQGYGSCLANTGDPKAALAQYQALLAYNPNDIIRFDVALLQWRTHANDDALTTLAPLLSGDTVVPALSLAAKIHEEEGDTPQAVELLRHAILRSPDDIDNYLEFASMAFAHSSFQVGIDMLNAGLSRLPNSASLYVARGVLEVQISQSEAAVADFEHAHRLDPKLSFAVDAMGIMRSQQHKSKESLDLFEAQAKLHPQDPFLQYLLAEQLAEGASSETGDRLVAAIGAAKRAVSLDPTYLSAHDLLAVLYLRAQQPELAIQQSQAALSLDPNDQDALYQEILARRRSGDTKQIQALVARFAEVRKENALRQQASDRYRLQDENVH